MKEWVREWSIQFFHLFAFTKQDSAYKIKFYMGEWIFFSIYLNIYLNTILKIGEWNNKLYDTGKVINKLNSPFFRLWQWFVFAVFYTPFKNFFTALTYSIMKFCVNFLKKQRAKQIENFICELALQTPWKRHTRNFFKNSNLTVICVNALYVFLCTFLNLLLYKSKDASLVFLRII